MVERRNGEGARANQHRADKTWWKPVIPSRVTALSEFWVLAFQGHFNTYRMHVYCKHTHLQLSFNDCQGCPLKVQKQEADWSLECPALDGPVHGVFPPLSRYWALKPPPPWPRLGIVTVDRNWMDSSKQINPMLERHHPLLFVPPL